MAQDQNHNLFWLPIIVGSSKPPASSALSKGSKISSEELWVEPGAIIVAESDASLNTIVGSGITVCIWNKEYCVGGMNHFLLPHTSEQAKARALYGNVAMFKLIDMMRERCSVGIFEAHVFGGASADEMELEVAEKNLAVAHKFLLGENIRIHSEQSGGSMQRQVHFNLKTGSVESKLEAIDSR